MNTRNLRYVLSAEDRASTVFQRVRGEIANASKETATLRGLVGPLVPQLAGAFTVAAVGAWVNRVTEGVDALNDLKDATGDSIGNLSALEDVALRTGTSLDTAGSAVIKLNQALGEASKNPDSGTGRAIKDLGLNIKDLLALSPVERLQAVGRAMNSFGDDNKLFYNLTLLGKGTRELTPLMNDLAEAGELQATMTDKQVKEAEKLRKEWAALEKDALDLSRTLAGPVVSGMLAVSKAMRDGFGLSDVPDSLGKVIGAYRLIGLARERITPLSILEKDPGNQRALAELARIDAEAKNITKSYNEAAEAVRRRKIEVAALYALADADNPANLDARDMRARRLPKLPGPRADDDGKARKEQITDAQQALASYVSGIERAIQAERNLSAEQEAQSFLKTLGVTGEIEQVRELVLRLAAEKDMREEIAGMAKLDAAARTEIIAKQIADQERLNRLLGETATGKEAERLDAVLFINKAFDEGRISLGQWVELTDQVNAKFEGIAATGKTVGDELAASIGGAAGQALLRWEGVGSLLKGILSDLAQIGVREAFTKPLGATLAKLFAADGHAFGSGGSVIPFAMGGVVNSPTLFRFAGGTGLMGEAGAEAIMPLARGRDGKLGVAASGGGGIHVTNIIHVGAGVSRNEVAAAMGVTKRQTIAAIADAQRRGYT